MNAAGDNEESIVSSSDDSKLSDESEARGERKARAGARGEDESDQEPTDEQGAKRRPKKKAKHSDEISSNDWDMATVQGQLTANPNMTEDEARKNAKREYNRLNAARARQRNKGLVADLQRQVADLTKRASDTQRQNDILKEQLQVLMAQNSNLIAQYEASQAQQGTSVASLGLAGSFPPSNNSATVNQQILAQLMGQQPVSQQQQQQPLPQPQKPAHPTQQPSSGAGQQSMWGQHSAPPSMPAMQQQPQAPQAFDLNSLVQQWMQQWTASQQQQQQPQQQTQEQGQEQEPQVPQAMLPQQRQEQSPALPFANAPPRQVLPAVAPCHSQDLSLPHQQQVQQAAPPVDVQALMRQFVAAGGAQRPQNAPQDSTFNLLRNNGQNADKEDDKKPPAANE